MIKMKMQSQKKVIWSAVRKRCCEQGKSSMFVLQAKSCKQGGISKVSRMVVFKQGGGASKVV
jgi:hypothetical protein